MNRFFLAVALALSAVVLTYIYRAIKGPTVFDRVVGLNSIGTKAIIMLVLVGLMYQRVDMFVDICLGYAVLNLVSALAVTKYLERSAARK
ncbi:MAG: pH regulation protein F [Vicinamibacteria bacterium]|nr:pH regulation protein F [Vicinamibacteria bacterium]